MVFGLGLGMTLIAGFSSCTDDSTFNDQNDKTNALEAVSREAQLAPATGTFCGNMHLTKENVDYAVVITLQVNHITTHASNSQDSTDLTDTPVLGGNMRFAVIENEGQQAYEDASQLMAYTGGNVTVFMPGTYTTQTHEVILPYTVPNYAQDHYGEITGDVENGQTFVGTWSVNSYGDDVGTFSLKSCGASS
jgi:hypothetical protein